jgi:hypothetical protein
MKSAIPPNTMIAPTAIAAAPVPLNPPPPEEVVDVGLVRTCGVVCGVAGVVFGVCGSPGERGLVELPWAAEIGADAPVRTSAHRRVGRKTADIARFFGQPRARE